MFNILLGCTLFVIGQTLVWFQLNSQFVWEWWQDKPIPAILLMGVPASFCFWFGVRLVVGEMNELWGPRFLAFGMSYLTHTYMALYEREHVCAENTNLCFIITFNCSGSAILENINEIK